MNNIKPTIRDIRVVLNALGLKHNNCHYNDKRVNGGRIKLHGTSFAFGDLDKIKAKMELLFPGFAFDVYNWGETGFRKIKSTCIKWEHCNNSSMNITNSASIKTSGSSLIGYVTTTYDKLVKAFGEPTYSESNCGKVTTEWALEFETASGELIVVTIYDWKTYDPSICRDGKFKWHVGGFRSDALDAVEAALKL